MKILLWLVSVMFVVSVLSLLPEYFINVGEKQDQRIKIWEDAKKQCLQFEPKYSCDLKLGSTFNRSPESF